MSSESPASHLARLKATYPGWLIERSATGTGYTAHRRAEHAAPNFIYAPTVPELEAALMKAARPGT